MWEIRLSGSERGWVTTRAMGEILWHRRETRRQTEKTNVALQPGEFPAYSKPRGCAQGRGRPITETKFLHEARERILGTVLLPARTKATFGRDIERFDLMPRTRTKRVRDDLWAQLDALPLGEDQAQSRAAASA